MIFGFTSSLYVLIFSSLTAKSFLLLFSPIVIKGLRTSFDSCSIILGNFCSLGSTFFLGSTADTLHLFTSFVVQNFLREWTPHVSMNRRKLVNGSLVAFLQSCPTQHWVTTGRLPWFCPYRQRRNLKENRGHYCHSREKTAKGNLSV